MPERKVRLGGAVPGATPPRRYGVGRKHSCATQGSPAPVTSIAELPKAPSEKNRSQDRPLTKAGGYADVTSPESADRPGPSKLEESLAPRVNQFAEPKHELRITISDPYSVLYELERYRGALEILFLLYLEGSANMSRMRQQLRPGQTALKRSLHALVRSRLVNHSRSQSFPFSDSYVLTDRGKELVEARFQSWPYVLAE